MRKILTLEPVMKLTKIIIFILALCQQILNIADLSFTSIKNRLIFQGGQSLSIY